VFLGGFEGFAKEFLRDAEERLILLMLERVDKRWRGVREGCEEMERSTRRMCCSGLTWMAEEAIMFVVVVQWVG
jgi:hypothetical protein